MAAADEVTSEKVLSLIKDAPLGLSSEELRCALNVDDAKLVSHALFYARAKDWITYDGEKYLVTPLGEERIRQRQVNPVPSYPRLPVNKEEGMSQKAYDALQRARKEAAELEMGRMKIRKVTITVTEHTLATILAAADVTLANLKADVVDTEAQDIEVAIKAVNDAWTNSVLNSTEGR